MRRSRHALASLVAVLLSVVACAITDAQSPAMQLIADSKGRFTIEFPADWHVVRPATGMIAVLGVAVAREGPNPASVNVVVEDLPRSMSSLVYAQASERVLRVVFHDYTLIQQGPATIAEQDAYYRYFTWQTNTGRVLYQVQVYFTVAQSGFVVTGSTLNDPESTRRYVPIIAQIIETFRPRH